MKECYRQLHMLGKLLCLIHILISTRQLFKLRNEEYQFQKIYHIMWVSFLNRKIYFYLPRVNVRESIEKIVLLTLFLLFWLQNKEKKKLNRKKTRKYYSIAQKVPFASNFRRCKRSLRGEHGKTNLYLMMLQTWL